VTFELAGGSRTGGGVLVQTVLGGGSATAPAVSRSGFNFVGWDSAFTNVTGNITVTAIWSQITIVDPPPDEPRCPECDRVICICPPPPTNCEDCGNHPCTCDDACPDCGNDPCDCDTEEPPVEPCPDCGNDPCDCDNGDGNGNGNGGNNGDGGNNGNGNGNVEFPPGSGPDDFPEIDFGRPQPGNEPGGSDPSAPPNPNGSYNRLVPGRDDNGNVFFTEIDDEDVPLGDWNWCDDDFWWFDPVDVPLAEFPRSLMPRTGILETPTGLYLLIFALSGIGSAGLIHGMKKRRDTTDTAA